MEHVNAEDHIPLNVVNNTSSIENDDGNVRQMTPQDTNFSQSNPYYVERRQMLSLNQRQRRQSMTEEQRQSYLARRRSSYQTRRMELRSSNTTSNQHQQHRWRLAQRNRRQSMNEEARSNNLANRRANYERGRQAYDASPIPNATALPNSELDAPNTVISESTHTISESCIDATTVRQTCRSEAIPYQTLTSNFERGNASTRQQPINDAPRGHLLNLNK